MMALRRVYSTNMPGCDKVQVTSSLRNSSKLINGSNTIIVHSHLILLENRKMLLITSKNNN